MPTYKVVRFFQNNERLNRSVIKTGLRLREAQAHCQDLETSSSTCTNAEGRKRTEKYGPWFDGYEAEAPTAVVDTFDGETQRDVAR